MLINKFGVIPSQNMGGLWLEGWKYGKKITIPANSVDEDLTNFPLTVYLNDSNFDFDKCAIDGRDIRFTDNKLNQLKFERKEHTQGYLKIDTSTIGTDQLYYEKTNIVSSTTTTVFEAEIKIVSSGSSSTDLVISNGQRYAVFRIGDDKVICNPHAVGTSPYTLYKDTKNKYYKYTLKYNNTNNVEFFIDDELIYKVSFGNLSTSSGNSIYFGDGSTGAGTGGTSLYKSLRFNIDYSNNPTNFTELDFKTLPSVQGWTATGSTNLGSVVATSGVYNVQVQQVSNLQDTEIYMWYGHESLTEIPIIEKTYLYNLGDENTALTGGWVYAQPSSGGIGKLTKNADHMILQSTNASGTNSFVLLNTNNVIDVTNCSKLRIQGSIVNKGTHTEISMRYSIGTKKDDFGGGGYNSSVAIGSVMLANGTPIDLTLDISNINNSYYVTFSTIYNSSIRIDKVWLEKEVRQYPLIYNTSIEAWQDQTGKQLTYNGNVKIMRGVNGTKEYIYNTGNEQTDITGGWNVYTYANGTGTFNTDISKKADSLRIFGESYNASVAFQKGFCTSIKVDVTKYSKLCLQGSIAYYLTENGSAFLGLTSSINNPSTPITSVRCHLLNNTDERTVVLDVSNLVGEYYIYLNVVVGYNFKIDGTVSKIWLEEEQGATFDGNGDYFTVPTTTDFDLSNLDFSYECCFKPNNVVDTQMLMSRWVSGSVSKTEVYIIHSTKNVVFEARVSSTSYTIQFAYTNAFVIGNTYHIEIVRYGNNLYCFINGVQIDTAKTLSVTLPIMNVPLCIGDRLGDATHYYFNGTMYGTRITKGRARHTSNFTPPTSFEIDGNDVVFCTNFDTIYDNNYVMVQHMGDTLVDASGNGNNGTATGTTVVNTEFGKAREFSGSKQYINIPNKITSDFTISSLFVTDTLVGTYISAEMSGSYKNYSFVVNTNILLDTGNGNATSDTSITGSTLINTGMYYVATAKRKSTTKRIYLNGNIEATGLCSIASPTSAMHYIASSNADTGSTFDGKMAEFRISNIARTDAWIKTESLALKNNLLTITDL